MGIFNKSKKGGISDIIRCDEKEYLVWKWAPNGFNQGDLKRETAIRTSSILRVKSGEVAAFFYKQKDNTMVDFIVGPYDEKLRTKNFPILSSIIGMWYEGDTPFQAEVFFINTSAANQFRFAVPYFDVLDPRFSDFQVPVSVRGTITFKIKNFEKFVESHQLASFSLEDLKQKMVSTISRYVKDSVTNAPAKYDIPVISIESKIDLINQEVENILISKIYDLFGVDIVGIDIDTIEIDKENESYLELKRITKDLSVNKVEADFNDYKEELRIKREENQYEKRMSTRQQNIGAYSTEVSGQVGIAGAEGFGKMSQNGVGNINLGDSGTGFNPVSLMAGMTLGSSIGKNIAGNLDNSINNSLVNSNTPPSISVTKYFIAKDGKAVGPYELSVLTEMFIKGEINNETLVWTQGMETWVKAELCNDLKHIFPPKL